jgi:hypothetical protein
MSPIQEAAPKGVPDNPYPPGHFRLSSHYQPWPHQVAFHESGAKYRLAVGSYGSGKSLPLLWEAVLHCIEHPGVNALMLRKTMPDLKRTVIDKFKTDIPREAYDHYHETDHIVYFKKVPKKDKDGNVILDPITGEPEFLQSKLFFAACEKEKDVGRFLSTEYVFIGFEELGEFPFFIWDALAGRNRCTIPGTRPCMAAATNPMGIGWAWIKKLFVDKKPFAGMDPAAYRARDYAYFHSTVDQNPKLRKDKEYLRTLEASPLRDRIRYGSLDAISGQYFENWDSNRHVRPRSDFIFEAWQPHWIGWDYGFGHWATMIWMTKAILKPRYQGAAAKRVNVVTRVRYCQGKTPEEQAKLLINSIPQTEDTAGKMHFTETLDSIHFSWERFKKTTSTFTVADEVAEYLAAVDLPKPTPSNTDRVAGWTKIFSLLNTDDLFLLETDNEDTVEIAALAEAIPLLVRGTPPQDIEDVVKVPGVSLTDDLGDGFRYAVAGMLLDPEDMPAAERERRRLAAIADPFTRAVAAYKAHNLKIKAERDAGQKPRTEYSWQRRLKPH